MAQVNVGLLGLGTIGTGVANALLSKAHLLEQRIGLRVALAKVCDRKLPVKGSIRIPRERFTKDAHVILRDPDIHIVVELIGGIEPAKTFILEALSAGKHVVTANKALIAEAGHELFAAADRYGVDLYFEASVGGGIPIIKALRESLIANELNAIIGIVNGTCNYILTQMREKQMSFHESLAEAQAHGYAERDSSLDVDGHDTAHKLAILTWLGFGTPLALDKIHTEGIRQVSLADIQYAEEMGYCIKLLAIAKRVDHELEVRVHPALLAKSHLLANVNGVYNGIYVNGDLVGAELFYGRGAGQNPTTSSVLSDIADVARNMAHGVAKRVPTASRSPRPLTLRAMDDIETRYYLRVMVIDKPGVLATIAGILGRHQISIASVSQKERRQARIVPVVMMTHDAKEANLRKALSEIDALATTRGKTVSIRMEAPRAR